MLWKSAIYIHYIYYSIICTVYRKVCFHDYKLSAPGKKQTTVYLNKDDTLNYLKKWRKKNFSHTSLEYI